MPTNTDWLKNNHFDLMIQASYTASFLENPSNRTRLGFEGINLHFLENEFMPKFVEFSTAFSIWENPADRTPRIIADLLEKEKVFKEVYRKLYMGFLKNNPHATDSDLAEMGLPKHSPSRKHPTPVPTDIPVCSTDTSIIRRISIHFSPKPKGVHCIEIFSAISDTPITNIKNLTSFALDTRSPYTFIFEDNQRGKSFYFAVRWGNTRGEKGPLSEIFSAIVP
jgi:hypothetical protein